VSAWRSWRLWSGNLSWAAVSSKEARLQNRLDTIVAMVEAEPGIGIIPSFALSVCRYRNVGMSRLVNPVVSLDFYQIRNRGRTPGFAGRGICGVFEGLDRPLGGPDKPKASREPVQCRHRGASDAAAPAPSVEFLDSARSARVARG
jgi:hypothetical protein